MPCLVQRLGRAETHGTTYGAPVTGHLLGTAPCLHGHPFDCCSILMLRLLYNYSMYVTLAENKVFMVR